MITDSTTTRLTEYKTVKLKLRKEQMIDRTHWRCTIHGEERIVTMQHVQYVTTGDMRTAMLSFSENEVIDIEIKSEELI